MEQEGDEKDMAVIPGEHQRMYAVDGDVQCVGSFASPAAKKTRSDNTMIDLVGEQHPFFPGKPDTVPGQQVSSVSSSANSSSRAGKQPKIFEGANDKLHAAISAMVNANGLSFSLPECQHFKYMIACARHASFDYVTPNQKLMSGPLLDNDYKVNRRDDDSRLLTDVELLGLGFQGDGATMKRCPLINHLAASPYCPVSVRKITDCSSWVEKGEKKDGTFVANEMKESILELDAKKEYADLCIMDGASVCKLSQTILEKDFPRMTCITGADHTGHNIFRYWCDIPAVQRLIVQDKVRCCSHYLRYLVITLVTSNYSCLLTLLSTYFP